MTASGEPLRVSVCHCQECRHRTGSALSVVVFYEAGQVTASGKYQGLFRRDDSGRSWSSASAPVADLRSTGSRSFDHIVSLSL
ncbi:GFA family protein [Agrobacterium tumefaciens]|uniref:GFA family protein n=1 Tax=Agrobacterium tumefaciens TaxID=358 RepID=UPI00307F7436